MKTITRPKRKQVATETNPLKAALKSGKSIVGLVGFVPTKDRHGDDSKVYVKVKVVGFSTESCGLKIEVTPLSGCGKFTISPCQWVASLSEIKVIEDQSNKKNLADNDSRKIVKDSYLKNRRLELESYVGKNCTKKQQDDFNDQVKELGGLAKLSASDVEWLSKVVAYQVHGVDEAPERGRYY